MRKNIFRAPQRHNFTPKSAMGKSKYLGAHAGHNRHSHQSPQDSTTPYSAVCFRNCCFPFWTLQDGIISDQQYQVSSFNLPSYCDSSLITPVCITQSPSLGYKSATKTEPILKCENAIRLSPSEMSPTFQFVPSDDDYQSRYNYNPPMKYKTPSGTLHASSTDSAFPISPFICPEPFWGAYGVSATPASVGSESSLSGNPSPAQLNSSGGLGNSNSSYSRQQASPQSSTGHRTQNSAPILIAPSPLTLRPATNSSRQSSLQSFSSAPSSTTLAQNPFSGSLGSLQPRGKKRKSLSADTPDGGIMLDETDRPDEILLLELTHQQHTPWKEVVDIFRARFGLDCTPSRLQMRKKRLIDRLRRWTEDDVRFLSLNCFGRADS